MNRELPTLQRDSHAEFSGPISISQSVPLMSDHEERCNSFHHGIKASRLMSRTHISPIYGPINPKSRHSWGPLSTSKPQMCNAALPGLETERRDRNNQRREAGIKPAQRLVWSLPVRSWRCLCDGGEGVEVEMVLKLTVKPWYGQMWSHINSILPLRELKAIMNFLPWRRELYGSPLLVLMSCVPCNGNYRPKAVF